jgi:BMFP domain-containing protein YqiC
MTYEEKIDALFEQARKNIHANIDAETEKFREEFNKSIDEAINKELNKLNPLTWFKRFVK